MKPGLALLSAAMLLACGRQELWQPGATGGAGGAAAMGGAGGQAGGGAGVVVTAGAGGGGLELGGASGGGGRGAGGNVLPPSQAFDDGIDLKSFAGLVLWLDATRGVTFSAPAGSNVFSWPDQSPSGNDLRNDGQEASVLFTADQRTLHGESGFQVVSFGSFATMATADEVNGTPTLGLGVDDFLIELVVTWQTSTFDRPRLFMLGAPHRAALSFDTDDSSQGEVSVSGLGEVLTSSPGLGGPRLHVVGVRRTVAGGGQTIELRRDGLVDQSQTSGEVQPFPPAAYALLGPACDIAEVVVIKGPISDNDLFVLENHLKAKYALQ